MIFITYWEINPDFDPAELAEIAQELMSKKIYPAEGIKQIAFYIIDLLGFRINYI
ncbi:unnamed protein product [marine sediment metagenome]|uniref:Uncharacterized protein n=1 Tax=marine sediment metagenome TaxID=412755 RepID=X0ZTA3_9ZZZZ